MELVAHARDEEGAQRVARLAHSRALRASSRSAVEDLVELIGRKEAGHLARVEDRVDVLEERLGDDLRVGEEKGQVRALIAAREHKEGLEVLAEVGGRVALAQLDRVARLAAEEGGKLA